MEILAVSVLGSQTAFFYTKITYGWILCYMLMVFQNIIVRESRRYGGAGDGLPG